MACSDHKQQSQSGNVFKVKSDLTRHIAKRDKIQGESNRSALRDAAKFGDHAQCDECELWYDSSDPR